MLVFFDIECASVTRSFAKICAFGYVTCDENFQLIEKRDILINPQGRFHLTDRKGQNGLVLPYDYNAFKTCPKFPEVYEEIKSLLEDPQNIVVGHSTINDVKYLDLETKRFKLPAFQFDFSDSQLIYMSMVKEFSRQFGLEWITKDLSVEFVPHRAADDAYATMRIVQAMCEKENCSLKELEEKFGIEHGNLSENGIVKPQSEGMRNYIKKREAEKLRRSHERERFSNYISRKRIKKNGKLTGIIFNFSREIEDDATISYQLIDKIYEKGGKYCQKLVMSNTYVYREGDTTMRTQNAKQMENIKLHTLAELEEILK